MADKAACLDTCMCYADPVERAAAAAELAFVNAANPFAGQVNQHLGDPFASQLDTFAADQLLATDAQAS